ncbi:MAG: response regulator [Nitrospirae bacterium]|nr:response regulator [Nitrospirota bacterium]MBF0540477.1 response regulator [Nitrospirota bacterium]
MEQTSKEKILIVDDEPLTIEMLSEILTESSYDVITAGNGLDALKLYNESQGLNLIISDMNMPNMNGLELIKKLKLAGSVVPIIILTGNNEISVAVKAINSGANDYLIKDENIAETIVMSVKRVLEKQEMKEQNERLLKDLEVKTQALLELNDDLAEMIVEEKKLREEKEQLLIQQSKMASMGEMIGAITHQWKQPLNALTILVQDLPDALKYEEINKEYIDELVRDAMKQIRYMSETITDFKNFFMPNQERTLFDVNHAVTVVLNIVFSQLKKLSIDVKVNRNIEDNFNVNGFQNEFMQVVLNIVNNAKDAIIEAIENGLLGKEEGKIKIDIYKINGNIVTEISDNAGGIPLDIIDKIFESYFTTKADHVGTGIGLYMAKVIIEEKMGGHIYANNLENGAIFTIELNNE